ncbi:MAG: S-layer homology domain-containing protein, partial [Desulfovibrio sp.]|nr:S-layer homology domain-containing protein [Desulfovibrio sp.]
EGMAWCVDKGILQGKGGGVLDPRTNVTRAEVAVMLQRFMELMK